MCYTGNCRYEDYNGDCKVKIPPKDAVCRQDEELPETGEEE